MLLLGLTGCCPFCLVPTDERATGKPKLSDLSSAAGEWYPEGRSQLCHQPDGEQVSVTFNRPYSSCFICLICLACYKVEGM